MKKLTVIALIAALLVTPGPARSNPANVCASSDDVGTCRWLLTAGGKLSTALEKVFTCGAGNSVWCSWCTTTQVFVLTTGSVWVPVSLDWGGSNKRQRPVLISCDTTAAGDAAIDWGPIVFPANYAGQIQIVWTVQNQPCYVSGTPESRTTIIIKRAS